MQGRSCRPPLPTPFPCSLWPPRQFLLPLFPLAHPLLSLPDSRPAPLVRFWLAFCLSVSLSLCLSVSVCLSVCVCFCQQVSVPLSLSLSVTLSVFVFVSVSFSVLVTMVLPPGKSVDYCKLCHQGSKVGSTPFYCQHSLPAHAFR